MDVQTDSTVDIVRKLMDNRALLVVESDSGIYDAMNKGFCDRIRRYYLFSE